MSALFEEFDEHTYEANLLAVQESPQGQAYLKEYRKLLNAQRAGLWGKLHRRPLADAIAGPALSLDLRIFLIATAYA